MSQPTPGEADPPVYPHVSFQECPVRASLGVLGRKWTLLILRDLTFYPRSSYSLILKRAPGLSGRMLSRRLKQLIAEDIVKRVPPPPGQSGGHYRLTEKGRDVIPVLTGYLQFGMRHHAGQVFKDGRPRGLAQVFPKGQGPLLGTLYEYARAGFAPTGRARSRSHKGPRGS